MEQAGWKQRAGVWVRHCSRFFCDHCISATARAAKFARKWTDTFPCWADSKGREVEISDRDRAEDNRFGSNFSNVTN